MAKILIVCTSNKDRSPALADYFEKAHPKNQYRSRGVNEYFCKKNGTTLISTMDLRWAEYLVFCEMVHYSVVYNKFEGVATRVFESKRADAIGPSFNGGKMTFPDIDGEKNFVILSCGDYRSGPLGEDYIARAEQILLTLLTDPAQYEYASNAYVRSLGDL